MQKVMLGNAKNLKNSENILCYQEPVIFIMKQTHIGKICFAKLFILDYAASTWIKSNLPAFFYEFCSRKFRHFLHKFAIRHFHQFLIFLAKSVFFSQKCQTFQKRWKTLLVSGNQYCHTESFNFWG